MADVIVVEQPFDTPTAEFRHVSIEILLPHISSYEFSYSAHTSPDGSEHDKGNGAASLARIGVVRGSRSGVDSQCYLTVAAMLDSSDPQPSFAH
jgi:hypothetical protein